MSASASTIVSASTISTALARKAARKTRAVLMDDSTFAGEARRNR
jgi:hypothetical protein